MTANSPEQLVAQTQASFRDKWSNNANLAMAATLADNSEIQRWILTRNGFSGLDEFSAFLKSKRRILDAGCGNGRVTALLARHASPTVEIVGIDFSSASIARANLSDHRNVTIETCDLLGDLRGLGLFDYVYCQEVLHHTADPARAFANLAARLAPGGEIAIYVYRHKAPAREFTDEFLREKFSHLSYDEAMQVARAIAEIGRQLHQAGGTVTTAAIDLLGIPAGTYSTQRFLYHFFLKCFWNEELSPEENAAIAYDWFHPEIASKHTLSEVREWYAGAGLNVIHEYIDEYGITVRGCRSA
jgi:2-polyprenyl-3-methyl-5-hydroxy-6-metoxy-1,4-benzoquinol methylase